jgi:hypothetical protein
VTGFEAAMALMGAQTSANAIAATAGFDRDFKNLDISTIITLFVMNLS